MKAHGRSGGSGAGHLGAVNRGWRRRAGCRLCKERCRRDFERHGASKSFATMLDSDEGHAWFREYLPHYLPPPVDEADAAFDGPCNITKRTALAVRHGKEAADLAAQRFGLRDMFDRKAGSHPDAAKRNGREGNPFLETDPAKRIKRIAAFIAAAGAASAANMARRVGRTITGEPLRK
jgi:hypothetical protein